MYLFKFYLYSHTEYSRCKILMTAKFYCCLVLICLLIELVYRHFAAQTDLSRPLGSLLCLPIMFFFKSQLKLEINN